MSRLVIVIEDDPAARRDPAHSGVRVELDGDLPEGPPGTWTPAQAVAVMMVNAAAAAAQSTAVDVGGAS